MLRDGLTRGELTRGQNTGLLDGWVMPLEVLVVFGGITAEAYFRRLSVTWVFVDGMGGVSVKGEIIIIFGWRGWRPRPLC